MDRKGKGRQKIDMAKIQNESHLQVTFSKRRLGVFKKANELATLCGAELGVLVFSPGGKAYSFGHPNVDTIIAKFNSFSPFEGQITSSTGDRRNATTRELDRRLDEATQMLQNEKKRGKELKKMLQHERQKHWFVAPIEEMNVEQLQQVEAGMMELRKQVTQRVGQLETQAKMKEQRALVPPRGLPNYFGGVGWPFEAGASGSNGFPVMPTTGFNNGAGPSSF
ncbi:unnamed protein product [Thlaspi arvense]|uniref:MADS-box domain-containing protein n=1 Tax=Thlaspi arvense TaxID=13288 RepID=A0AAU9RRL5_THLAR|nr:unnamed protein product [Thlaspi arvense]